MAGAVLGEVQVSVFVVGAVLGEVQVSLCVVGAGLGEIWKDSRSAKCCIFQYKPFVRSAKSNLGCVAGCGLTETVSERSRIGRALEMTFQLFSANFCQMLDGHFAWQAQYLVSLEGDIPGRVDRHHKWHRRYDVYIETDIVVHELGLQHR